MSRVQLLGKKPTITDTPLMSVGSSRVRLLDEKTTIPPSTISPENKITLDKYMSKGIRTARAKQIQNEMIESGQAAYPTEPITIPSREKQNFFSEVSEKFLHPIKTIKEFFKKKPVLRGEIKKEELAKVFNKIKYPEYAFGEIDKESWDNIWTATLNKKLKGEKLTSEELKLYEESNKKMTENLANMVLGAVSPMKTVSEKIAKDLIKKKLVKEASKLTRKDLIEITRGKISSGAKYDAYKIISGDPQFRSMLSNIAKNKKISLKSKVYNDFKSFFDPLFKPKFKPKTNVVKKYLPLSEKQITKIPGSRVPIMGKKEIITKAIPNKLTEQAKKYKTTINIRDKDDIEYLERILGKDNVDDILKGKMTNFRGKSYEDLAKVNIISKKPKTIAENLKGKIKPYNLKTNTIFHGTSAKNTQAILEQGFKKGSSLPEDAFRSGGYGQIQDSISFSLDPKIASIFTGTEKRGVLFKLNFKKNSKIVEIDGITHAEELNEFIPELKKQKIDAVYLPGEEEIVVINKNILGKIKEHKEFEVFKAKSELKDIWNKAKTSEIKPITKAIPDKLTNVELITNEITKVKTEGKSFDEFADEVFGYRTEYTDYNNEVRKIVDGVRPDELGFDGEKYITVYRGVPKEKNIINQGDFVATDYQTAKIYAGEGDIISKKVKIKDLIIDESGVEISAIKEADKINVPGAHYILNKNRTGIKTKSQLKDIWNKAKASETELTTKKNRKRRKTGKEQLAEREEIKTKKKALTFYEEDFENQYQNFKKLKNKDAEDIEQLKSKNKNISATEIDNILYSQEKTGDEVFNMFAERLAKEKELVLPKIPKETKAVIREKAVSKIKTAKEILDRRRVKIRAVRDHFNLTDIELKSITQRDIRLMSNIEFKQFIDNIRIKAEKLSIKRQAMNELLQQIKDKELNVGNLRKAMKLPTMKNMTVDDIHKLDEALMPFQKGDEFLSVRKLETVDRTELKGIKTWREARERLAKKLNVPVEKLQNIKVSEFDRFRYDTGLAERNPFYKMMVEEPAKKMLMSETEYLKIEKKTLALAKKLKQKGLIGRLIPQQKNIREFMETPVEKRKNIKMTQAEIDLAEYMTQNFDEARNYLVMVEAMKMGKDNYFTHIRRGILEAVKEDGLIKAVKEVFTQYKLEEQAFDILDKQTGEILAMDKFFKFAMHRTGGLIPTENTVKAFLSYMKTFKKKQALDEIVPLVDIYAHSITPKGLTEKGLLLHGNLITFVKEWLNMKKGRHITLIAKQNGRIDGALRAIKMFTSLRDLGLNIPVSLTTEVGEQITTYQLLGKKKYAAGKIRQNTKQGKKIIEKYRNLVGKNPWKELVEPSKNIGDRLMEGLFIMFRDSSERANRTFLLGSLSKQEFKAGEISPDRLSALRTELGKYRMVEGMKSIIGATPEGKAYTQYKTWAIPALRTTIKNLSNVGKKITGQKIGSKEWKKSLLELYRLVEITAFAMLMFSMVRDEDDDSFVGKIINKGYNEATTLIQALSPRMFLAVGRTASFVEDLGISLTLILQGEKYKTTDKYKGVEKLKRQFKPVVISQFKRKEEKKTTSTIRRRKRTPRVRRRRK